MWKRKTQTLRRFIGLLPELYRTLRRILELAEHQSMQLASFESQLQKLWTHKELGAGLETSVALLAAGFCLKSAEIKSRPISESNYRKADLKPIEFYLSMLRDLHPRAFVIWKNLFENGKRSYYEQREASCSHRDQWYARLFGSYVNIYAVGRLLDIGCGPHGVPSYLSQYNRELLSGLDPLELTGVNEFEYVRGINEFLPWPDRSFQTVVSGTSLDHVLNLDRALSEVARVLTPSGHYLVWIASVPGACPYDPDSNNLTPVDQFHLFHFDRVWVEPLFEKYFAILDATVIPQAGFDHIFYCMRPLIRDQLQLMGN
jgi:SAM-dependent methyltransferase